MLSKDPSNRHLNRALADLQTLIGQGNRDLTPHAQIYRLGIILTELATGSRVTYAEINNDLHTPGLKLVLPALGPEMADTRLGTAEVAREVEHMMGKEYANLVGFCLGIFEQRGKMTLMGVEREFERSLLVPAR